MVLRRSCLLLLLIGAPAAADVMKDFPPPSPRPRATVTRADGALRLDGRLDEPAWASALPLSAFRQVDPDQLEPARHATTVRVLATDDGLWVGARCDDEAGSRGIQQTDLRRDFNLFRGFDWFGVVLDPLGDGRNAFGFFVTPWGSQHDVQVIDDEIVETQWDTVWRVAVTRDEAGFTVELELPWKSLRTEPDRLVWGFNAVRAVRRTMERSAWSPYPRTFSPFRMPYAGELAFTEAPTTRTRLNLQVRPYAIVRADGDGVSAPTLRPNAGGEVTWAPTPNTVVDLTGNTDFAEVDVDRRVVNLSRFNVLFPERRQFFLENAGLFTMGQGLVQPFFSRAIGLSNGQPQPLSGGARLVYRSAERSAGGMVVHTLPTDAQRSSVFGVARYSHHLLGESRAGGMVVLRHDFEAPGLASATNVVPVVDALVRKGPLSLTAMLSGSVDQVHDGTPSRLGLAGAVEGSLQGNWGDLTLRVAGLTPGYRARSGFVSRTEALQASANWYLDYRPAWLPKWVRTLQQFLDAQVLWSTKDGSFQEANAYFEAFWVTLAGGDRGWVYGQRTWQFLDREFAPVPGVSFPQGSYVFDRVGVAAYSEQSRLFSVGGNVGVGRYYLADFVRAQGQVGFSPVPHVGLFLNYELNRFEGEGVQWASRVAVTHLVQLEARLALTPRLQLIGSYQRDTAGNVGLLNARLAWEFLPLSFVYVVFTDTRGAFQAGPGQVPEQRLVVKATYTWRP
ncbi:MAG: carbohydrate binding family 9 domain-containing protein [Myxococcaceae bacterium]|nr:carbohydrate binding family 9 domain-containing protein [Myxococcaceae bacterium]MCA3012619.1 carbohydrate binding family 9 domain-containing protein [Myxococcaceae bacterium]